MPEKPPLCQICQSPTEPDDDMHNTWCELCFEDMSIFGIALMTAKTEATARGHWFNCMEWLRGDERKSGKLGLANCDTCGNVMRVSFPIGSGRVYSCHQCSDNPTDEPMGFFRVSGELYRALDNHRERLGMTWEQFMGRVELTLRRRLAKAVAETGAAG